MDIKNAISELKMENLFFPLCKVERKVCKIINGELTVNVTHNITNLEDHKYELSMKLTATKDDLNVEITASAIFVYTFKDEDKEKEKRIINANTLAMVLPYLRSQLTLITSQPNMTPVILPPVNVTKF